MATFPLVADSVRGNATCPMRFEQALQRYNYAIDRLHTELGNIDEANELLADPLCLPERSVMRELATKFGVRRTKVDIVPGALNSIPFDASLWTFFADKIRLAGGGTSRLFNPAYWLRRFERLGANGRGVSGKLNSLSSEETGALTNWLSLDARSLEQGGQHYRPCGGLVVTDSNGTQ